MDIVVHSVEACLHSTDRMVPMEIFDLYEFV